MKLNKAQSSAVSMFNDVSSFNRKSAFKSSNGSFTYADKRAHLSTRKVKSISGVAKFGSCVLPFFSVFFNILAVTFLRSQNTFPDE